MVSAFGDISRSRRCLSFLFISVVFTRALFVMISAGRECAQLWRGERSDRPGNEDKNPMLESSSTA
jgi:hypothetical protein